MKFDSKSVKQLGFSGRRKDFDAFKLKFMSWAGMNKLKPMLEGKEKIPEYGVDYGIKSDGTEIVPEEQAKMEELLEKNQTVFTSLVLSIDGATYEGKQVLKIVENTICEAYPDGNCYEAYAKLVQKFKPVNSPILSLLHEKFYTRKLRGGNPVRYLEEMENLRMEMSYGGVKMEDDHFLRIVFNGLGEDYLMIIEEYERLLDTSNDRGELLEQLRAKLELKYDRKRLNYRFKQEENKNEKALLALNKKFSGKCFKCGKWGHKGADCDENKNKGKKKEGKGIQCFKCKKFGHIKRNCPDLKNTDLATVCQPSGVAFSGVTMLMSDQPELSIQDLEPQMEVPMERNDLQDDIFSTAMAVDSTRVKQEDDEDELWSAFNDGLCLMGESETLPCDDGEEEDRKLPAMVKIKREEDQYFDESLSKSISVQEAEEDVSSDATKPAGTTSGIMSD